MNEVPLDGLSAARFTELVGTQFRVAAGPRLKVDMALVTVTGPDRRGHANSASGSPIFEVFSLVFEGPAEPPLVQGAYRFSHEAIGWFDLFIVPVGAERGTRQYEAVFNRRVAHGT